MLFSLTNTVAAQVYRYKDERGRWVYSDKTPADAEVEEVVIKQSAKQPRVFLDEKKADGRVTYTATNEFVAPVEVVFGLLEANNVTPSVDLPLTVVIPPGDSQTLVILRPTNPNIGLNFQYRWAYMLGDPKTVPDSNFLYRAPFAISKSHDITQAFNGSFSHNQPHSQFAVDIDMPVGTDIFAARAGIVITMATQFFGSGTDVAKFASRANNVMIFHDDGTIGVYAHLRWDSIRVRPGQRVKEGELIADSGDTGFSTGPHLHFAVQRNAGMELRAVPFKFRGQNNAAVQPREGMKLTAY